MDDFALNRPDPAAADQGLKLINSTIHSAKGKEFNAVFCLGLTENRFPSCGQDNPNYEEEQRLFYVSCTRARRQLFLTWPEMIITPDKKHRLGDVSPFLRDIDPALYDTVEAVPCPSTLLFWAAFVVGTVISLRLCAAAVNVMDETMPFGCPPQLRRLTWTLAAVWSISMFSEGILQSGYLLVRFRQSLPMTRTYLKKNEAE